MKQILTIFFLFITLQVYPFEYNNSSMVTQMPSSEFKSVNNQNICSGSKYASEITPAFQNTQNIGKPVIRKVKDDPYDPFLDPIGDTPVIFMICLIGLYIAYKKWKRIKSLPF